MNDTPLTDRDSLINLLVQHEVLSDGLGWEVRQPRGGLNSTVFVVADPDGHNRYSIRRIDRTDQFAYETSLLAELRHCACVPALRVAVPETRLLVTDYVPGTPAPLHDATMPALERLADCLARIHGRPRQTYSIWPSIAPQTGSRAGLYRERLESLHEYPSSSRDTWPEIDPRIRHLLGRLRENLPDGGDWNERRFSPLHGDLSIGNIIWNGAEVGLIDWEYARDGDPAEEIAYLLTEQTVSARQVQTFRDAYLAASDDTGIWSRVERYAPLVALDSGLWWIDHLLQTGEEPRISQEVSSRLDLAWVLVHGQRRI